jgi:hypothetical protein
MSEINIGDKVVYCGAATHSAWQRRKTEPGIVVGLVAERRRDEPTATDDFVHVVELGKAYAELWAARPGSVRVVERATYIPASADPAHETAEDTCRVYDVDGEPVRVHGAEPMDEKDQAALAEVVRAARTLIVEDPGPHCRFGWEGCDNYTGGHTCNRAEGHPGRHRCDCGSLRRQAADPAHQQQEGSDGSH